MVKLYCKALMEETTLYNSASGRDKLSVGQRQVRRNASDIKVMDALYVLFCKKLK